MRTERFRGGLILVLALFIGSLVPITGCNDESRTTGTMVEVSEEAKAQLKAKRESYQGGSPKNKAKAANKKK